MHYLGPLEQSATMLLTDCYLKYLCSENIRFNGPLIYKCSDSLTNYVVKIQLDLQLAQS